MNHPQNKPTIELTLKKITQKDTPLHLRQLEKSSLWNLLAPLADILKSYNVQPANGSSKEIAEKINMLSNPRTQNLLFNNDLAIIYQSFTSSPSNLPTLAELEPRLRKAWNYIITSPEVDSDYLEDILGRKLPVVSIGYWNRVYLIDSLLAPLKVTGSYHDHLYNDYKIIYSLSLTSEARKSLGEMFLGWEAVSARVTAELPEGENLVTEEFEASLPSDLLYLSTMAITGTFKADSPITAARLKSFRKNFDTSDFRPYTLLSSLDRTELLFNIYSLFHRHNASTAPAADPKKFSKFILDNLAYHIRGPWFGMLLPRFKSFTKAWADDSYVVYITQVVNQLLREGNGRDWMSLDNLRLRYMCSGKKGSHYSVLPLFGYMQCRKSTLKTKATGLLVNETFTDNDWFEEIDFGFVLNWIKMLCATGLLEIAQLNRDDNLFSNLEGMRYVRLTPLGRYAFGYEEDYQPPIVSRGPELEVDDANRIVTVLSESCPYTMFLQQVARRISPTRYLITDENLVKGCDSLESAEKRLENFRNIIDLKECPEIAKTIEIARRRIKSVERRTSNYTVYQLDPAFPELVRLIATDSKIRPNVILAEKGMVMVKNTFLPDFKSICSRHGFIVS